MTSILTPADSQELAKLLFPDADKLPTLAQLEQKFPERKLAPGAQVVRIAPSPTGFAHIGLVYMAIINRKIAHQSGGVFILRVEDTDSKREVEGAFETIVGALSRFGQTPDEGFVYEGGGASSETKQSKVVQVGAYGPYQQSDRRDIYRAAAMHLVATGMAYPCFSTEEELKESSALQTAQKARPGYYGYWARWRDRSLAEIKEQLSLGKPYVIRLRSPGDPHTRLTWHDSVKGRISVPQNDLDVVILKSDGQSLYHLAHMVDDHFMRVNFVARGDEWLSSAPLHIQLFESFKWAPPQYAHLSTIQKLDTITEIDPESGKEVTRQSKRKLSKRKDPEANVEFYFQAGFPPQAVVEYLMNIANSDFEDWRKSHLQSDISEFQLKVDKLSPSAALADPLKLANISKEVVGRISTESIYSQGLEWARKFDPELAELMASNKELTIAAIDIERSGPKPSKRIGCWSDLRGQLIWFYESGYEQIASQNELPFPENITPQKRSEIITAFLSNYNPQDSRDQWFAKCKELAAQVGLAPEMKEFKSNPAAYPGHIGDFTNVLRVAISGSRQSPELCEVMKVLGLDTVRARLERFL